MILQMAMIYDTQRAFLFVRVPPSESESLGPRPNSAEVPLAWKLRNEKC